MVKCIKCNLKQPVFNIATESKALYCSDCKDDNMVNVKSLKCIKCKLKQPNFNIPTETKALYCFDCKDDNMVNLNSLKCIKCNVKQPTFNTSTETTALYCSDCKDDNMIDVYHSKCLKCNLKYPNFNLITESKPLYCSDCKDDNMVDVKSLKCIKCKLKQPNFNIPVETKALYCFDCKDDNMINVNRPKCIKCKLKYPIFNLSTENKALYCSECKDDNMLDVHNRKCIKCKLKHPNFNISTEKKALYCSDCKTDNMINVKCQKCIKCKLKCPIFNLITEKKPLYCSDCKDDNMFDLVNPKCHCGTRALFGIPGQKPSVCSKHKTPGTVSNPRTKCKHKGCKSQATHGIVSPVRCETHAEENHYNLVCKECVNCKSIEICNQDGICYEFCINTDIYNRRRKVWEFTITQLLSKGIKKRFYSLDSPLDSNCNSKRPDIVYDCGSHFVIVEVDEKQHKYYGDTCETNRMMMIAQAAGAPVIFIRYNPDSYLLANGNKSNISDTTRSKHLIKVVGQALHSPALSNDEYIRVVYLFYDGYAVNSESVLLFSTIALHVGFFNYKLVDEPKRKRKICDTDPLVRKVQKI